MKKLSILRLMCFVREKFSNGVLKLVSIESRNQIADVLTKSLLISQHDFLCNSKLKFITRYQHEALIKNINVYIYNDSVYATSICNGYKRYNMSNIAKLEFPALEVTGKNYMPWTIDVEMHLESMRIRDAINFINDCSLQDKARAHVFLRKHIDQMLRIEYLNVSDPSTLWTLLKERFDHQREIMLPNTRSEWMSLRFQDFKKVNEYNSALFRICSQLKFCGEEVSDEEMLEKTYSTFHASNITLMQQYRLQMFTRYSKLNACLVVAEQNNDL
ncbi:hypothetical protein LXL04_022989 [Taraxacum kok-saghyz]